MAGTTQEAWALRGWARLLVDLAIDARRQAAHHRHIVRVGHVRTGPPE